MLMRFTQVIHAKLPFKNSKPPCASPTVGTNYHGFVMADALVKGLRRGAIATSKLKGVKAGQRTRGLYWFGPLR